jgi:rhodanese-related sulfurtransferase
MSNYKDLSPKDFKIGLESNPNAKLIDCRTYPELIEFKLDFNFHIDIMSPAFGLKLQELDKNSPYYVYCRSGNRSAFLCDFMARQGFKELFNLDGGIIAWRNTF